MDNNQHGFTLLEIMLVLLLIGMISVGVVMTLPNTLNPQEQVDWQAQRFSALLQFAQDEALISGLQLAIVFDEQQNDYQFASYDYDKQKWLALANHSTLKRVELPETMKLEYTLTGSVWDELNSEQEDDFIDQQYLVDIDIGEEESKGLTPQVYVMSSGEVTPFSVQFTSSQGGRESEVQQVSVTMNGAITMAEIDK